MLPLSVDGGIVRQTGAETMSYPENPDLLCTEPATVRFLGVAHFPTADIPFLDLDLADDDTRAQASLSYDFERGAWHNFIYIAEQPDGDFSSQIDCTRLQAGVLHDAVPEELRSFVAEAAAAYSENKRFDNVERPDVDAYSERSRQPRYVGMTAD
jgi:hypothetical protein